MQGPGRKKYTPKTVLMIHLLHTNCNPCTCILHASLEIKIPTIMHNTKENIMIIMITQGTLHWGKITIPGAIPMNVIYQETIVLGA